MTTKSTFCYTKEDINDVTSFQKKRNKCLYAVESKKGVFNVFLVYAKKKIEMQPTHHEYLIFGHEKEMI